MFAFGEFWRRKICMKVPFPFSPEEVEKNDFGAILYITGTGCN